MAAKMNFGELFGKHPFKPMKRHMKLAVACAHCLPGAVEAFLAGDKVALREARDQIAQLEKDADAIFAEIQDRLPASVFTPVARRDLLDVLEMQEAIADRCEDIVGLLMDLPLEVPEEMASSILRLTHRCVEATEEAREIVKLIDLLLNTGFKGPNVEVMKEKIQDVLIIETDADTICNGISHELFLHTKDMDAVAVIFLYKLVGWIDDLADYSEKLAIRARIVLAR
jgi:predicted phosphate transport protein (TIGR00153 family)